MNFGGKREWLKENISLLNSSCLISKGGKEGEERKGGKEERFPFHIAFIEKRTPLTYLLKNTVTAANIWINLQKRRKPTCLFHVVLNKLNDTVTRCVCLKHFN